MIFQRLRPDQESKTLNQSCLVQGRNTLGVQCKKRQLININIEEDSNSLLPKDVNQTLLIKTFYGILSKFSEFQEAPSFRPGHEAYYVMCMRPTLNNQLELTSLTLFRIGVT